MTGEHVAEAARKNGLGPWAAFAVFLLLAYAGWLALGARPVPEPFGRWSDADQIASAAPETPPPVQPAPGEEPVVAPINEDDPDDDGEDTPRERVTSGPPPTALAAEPNARMGRSLPHIDTSRSVAVAEGQALLVVEHVGGDAAPRVRVGGRDLGPAPIAVALAAGRHEIVTQQGDDARFRYVLLRAGETRILDAR